MFYPRKTVAEISLRALASNFYAIKSLLAPATKLVAMMKANAYGHGAVLVAREMEKLGADMLGVSCVYEVIELRNAGIKIPIINIGPTFEDDAAAVFEYNYVPTIFSFDIAKKISDTAINLNKKAKIHIKVDSGMGRIGVACEDALQLVRDIKKLPNIEIEGLFTHFADAEAPNSEATKTQLQKFNDVLQQLREAQIEIPLIHAAKSAATLFWPQSHFNMVRIGISLYGYSSSGDENIKSPIKLEPVMTLKTRVSHVKIVPQDTPISYGGKFRTTQRSVIATLAVGYADGARRTPQNWGEVLCGGKRAPIVGVVCMDQMMIDVTAIDNVKVGDEVVLIGKQGNEVILAWDVAKRAATSAFEVLSGVSARVTRVIIG